MMTSSVPEITEENPHKLPTLSTQQSKEITTYLQSLGTSLTEAQTQQFITLCREFQLNPFKREIYGVAYGDKFNIIVGYEVYIKRADRSQKLDGWERGTTGEGDKMKAWIKIYRKDWKMPFYHEVDYSEYVQTRWDYDQKKFVVNAMWASKPKTMLQKVVTAQAFRLAFPDEFAGMPYTSDEIPTEEGVTAGLPKIEGKLEPLTAQPKSDDIPAVEPEGIKMSQNAPAAPSSNSPHEIKKQTFWKMLEEMHGQQAADVLEKLTSFKGRDGKIVPGKRTMDRVSAKQLGYIFKNVEKEYEGWKGDPVVNETPAEDPGDPGEPPGFMDAPPPQEEDDLPF